MQGEEIARQARDDECVQGRGRAKRAEGTKTVIEIRRKVLVPQRDALGYGCTGRPVLADW